MTFLDPQSLSHLIFSTPILLRRRVIEPLGGPLVSSQGQASMISKSTLCTCSRPVCLKQSCRHLACFELWLEPMWWLLRQHMAQCLLVLKLSCQNLESLIIQKELYHRPVHIPECSFLAVQNLSFCFILFSVNPENKSINIGVNLHLTLSSLLQFLAGVLTPWQKKKKIRNSLFCTEMSHSHLQGHVPWTKYHWWLLQYVSKQIFLLRWKIYFNICFFIWWGKQPLIILCSQTLIWQAEEVHVWLWLCQGTHWDLFTPGEALSQCQMEVHTGSSRCTSVPQQHHGYDHRLQRGSYPRCVQQKHHTQHLGTLALQHCLPASVLAERGGQQRQLEPSLLHGPMQASTHPRDMQLGQHNCSSIISALMQPVNPLT